VSVSHTGRVFVNVPKRGDDVAATVVELVDGRAVPFRPRPERRRADRRGRPRRRDRMETDTEGTLYFTNVEHNAVLRRLQPGGSNERARREAAVARCDSAAPELARE
jgi:hypothetical protein